MEGKGIRWSGVLRERGVPCDVLRLGNQAERCSRKDRWCGDGESRRR